MSDATDMIEEARKNADLRHKLTEIGRDFYNEAESGPLGKRMRSTGLVVLAEGLLADNPPRPGRQTTLGKERS
jgi:hypothetical protein